MEKEELNKERLADVKKELDTASNYKTLMFWVNLVVCLVLLIGGFINGFLSNKMEILIAAIIGSVFSTTIYMFAKVICLISKNLTKLNNKEEVLHLEKEAKEYPNR